MISAHFTLREAFRRFYRVNGIKPSTLSQLRYALNWWEGYTANPSVHDVGPETFDGFRRLAEGKLAPITVERTIDRMLSILRLCARRGVIASVPDAGDRLMLPPPDPRVIQLESLSAMYAACGVAQWPCYRIRERGTEGRAKGGWWAWRTHDWAQDFWRCFLAVSYLTALRLGDLLDLRRSDFSGDVLAVNAAKTGKLQSLPIHPVMRRHVQAVTWATGDEPLFPVGQSLKQFRRELARICTAAKVDPVTPQDVRVASANQWEAAFPGAGPAVLGHSIVRGASRFYLRPALPLEEALPRLKLPTGFLTDAEKQAGHCRITELLARFERMDAESQELLLGMARRIG